LDKPLFEATALGLAVTGEYLRKVQKLILEICQKAATHIYELVEEVRHRMHIYLKEQYVVEQAMVLVRKGLIKNVA